MFVLKFSEVPAPPFQNSAYATGEDLFFFFFWSSPKSGQKNGPNLSEDFFFVFIFSSLELRSFFSSFYLPFEIPGYAPAPPPPSKILRTLLAVEHST